MPHCGISSALFRRKLLISMNIVVKNPKITMVFAVFGNQARARAFSSHRPLTRVMAMEHRGYGCGTVRRPQEDRRLKMNRHNPSRASDVAPGAQGRVKDAENDRRLRRNRQPAGATGP